MIDIRGRPALLAQTIVALVNSLVTDLLDSSAARIEASGVSAVEAVRALDDPLLGFSDSMVGPKRVLKRFLEQNFYRHPHVLQATERAERVVHDLFETYRREPERLPTGVQLRFKECGEARAVADYVAGMTDRFACSEHERLLQ